MRSFRNNGSLYSLKYCVIESPILLENGDRLAVELDSNIFLTQENSLYEPDHTNWFSLTEHESKTVDIPFNTILSIDDNTLNSIGIINLLSENNFTEIIGI